MSATPDDDALMIRTAGGEEAAFRLLVLRWESQVRAFLIHMLGSVEEAEDLVQETFIKVFRQAGRYRPEGRFRSWLFRIAGNLARSRLRRRKVLKWITLDRDTAEVADSEPSPQANLERVEDARRLRSAIAGLPERQRQALVMHRFQDMKYREIARVMETTLPGVESLIQRALAQLRVVLTEEETQP